MAGRNPKCWVAAMSCGIFFEIWPFEKAMAFIVHPSGGSSKPGPQRLDSLLVGLPIVALFFFPWEACKMRKIWILSAFLILMGVNSFDFRCNLPDERLRQETKKDQRGVQVSQNPAFAHQYLRLRPRQ
jgi:hypothetical protein